MTIVIAGGSGFLGRPLAQSFARDGHDVVVLTRRPAGPASGSIRFVEWQPHSPVPGARNPVPSWFRVIESADAIVNLAGEGIADRRWSVARKQALRDSRILSTRGIVAAIAAGASRPRVLLNGSGIGYYGDTGDAPIDEASPAGRDFLARLCVDWEAEAQKATAFGCRVVAIRSAPVLARDGGALKKMIPPFLLFAGGPIASGRQYMPWIHRDDWIAMARWAIDTPSVVGPINGTAPNPERNAEFMRALGRALHRPSWLPMPTFALRLLVGEIADVALATGQRAMPKRPLELGFRFRYAAIEEAMAAAVTRS